MSTSSCPSQVPLSVATSGLTQRRTSAAGGGRVLLQILQLLRHSRHSARSQHHLSSEIKKKEHLWQPSVPMCDGARFAQGPPHNMHNSPQQQRRHTNSGCGNHLNNKPHAAVITGALLFHKLHMRGQVCRRALLIRLDAIAKVQRRWLSSYIGALRTGQQVSQPRRKLACTELLTLLAKTQRCHHCAEGCGDQCFGTQSPPASKTQGERVDVHIEPIECESRMT